MSSHRYQQLYSQLKHDIQRGLYKGGDLLPSENELSQLHQITRVTVRQALTELVKDGFITRIKGKGSIVNQHRKAPGLLVFEPRPGHPSGLSPRQHAIFLKRPASGPWPDPFEFALAESELEAGCVWVEAIRFAGDEPVAIEQMFMPHAGLPEQLKQLPDPGQLFNFLSLHASLEIESMEQLACTSRADETQAFLLNMEAGAPLLHLRRRFATSRPGWHLYSLLWVHTAHVALRL
ncbi:MAG: GntR family transcriptional regulator [Bacteroidia bacterium]|nr:GntR family transcriptional regulator [Bacteroidia bacterium]